MGRDKMEGKIQSHLQNFYYVAGEKDGNNRTALIYLSLEEMKEKEDMQEIEKEFELKVEDLTFPVLLGRETGVAGGSLLELSDVNILLDGIKEFYVPKLGKYWN